MKNKDAKLLASVKDGEKVKVVSITAGCALNGRLCAMGILPGVEIIVVNNKKAGGFVVKIKEAKLVLGRGIANKIMVS